MNPSKMKEEEIIKAADPIWDNIVKGSNSSNYSLFSKDFSKQMISAVPKEEMERQIKTVPILNNLREDRTLLGVLKRDTTVMILWKQKSTIDDIDYLATLVLGEENGETKVFGASIV